MDERELVTAAALSSCVTEAITLNCARTGVPLEGLEVAANVDVDPGPIIGVKDLSDWNNSLKVIQVKVIARGKLSERDRKMVEEGATRSPVHHIFSSGKQVKTTFRYESQKRAVTAGLGAHLGSHRGRRGGYEQPVQELSRHSA